MSLLDDSDFKRLLLGLPERECDGCGKTDTTVCDCYAVVARTYQPPMQGLSEHWALCLNCRMDGFSVDEGDSAAWSIEISKVHRA